MSISDFIWNVYFAFMFRFLLILFIISPVHLFSQVSWNWSDFDNDDFSFAEKWEYHEGVFLNKWGQLSCDGLCPREIDALKDENGRIYDDSLTKFYSIIDTTHRYYSHEGDVRVYEYDQCNHAFASIVSGKIHVQTEVNIATHTSLHIVFDPDNVENPIVRVYLMYNSIRDIDPEVYFALTGDIYLSGEKLEQGIVQMSFDLGFQSDDDDPKGMQTWKGKIYTSL